MKTKLINTITSNEEDIRFRIYLGDLTPHEGYEELLRIEKEQRKSDNYFNLVRVERLIDIINELKKGKIMNEVHQPTVDVVAAKAASIPAFLDRKDEGKEVKFVQTKEDKDGVTAVDEPTLN